MSSPSILERAFELARTGRCPGLDEIRKQLGRELYENVDLHLASPTLRRQLREACLAASRAAKGADPNGRRVHESA